MIIGIGVDVVDVARFEKSVARTPGVLTRLFTAEETVEAGQPRPLRSMAARFAAKEAVIKAIGDSAGVRWHDMAVVSDGLRNPSIEVYNALADIVAARGITTIHLSISHDAGIAMAYVIAEGPDTAQETGPKPASETGPKTQSETKSRIGSAS